MLGNCAQGFGDVIEPVESLLAKRLVGVFRAGMDHEIAHTKHGGGFDGGTDFPHRGRALGVVDGGDVDVIGEGRVEGIGADA